MKGEGREVNRKAVLMASVFLILALGLIVTPVAGSPVELYYDDGGAEVYTYSTIMGAQVGVRFSLPIGWTSAKILKAKYYIYSIPKTPASFKVCIYDSDGMTELTTPFTVTITTTGWFEVDLSGLNIVVSNDFYIAEECVDPGWANDPTLGGDSSSPDSRSYTRSDSSKSWDVDTIYDWMIRAVVEPPAPVGGFWVPIDKFELLAPWMGLVSVIASIVAISGVIIKRTKKHQN